MCADWQFFQNPFTSLPNPYLFPLLSPPSSMTYSIQLVLPLSTLVCSFCLLEHGQPPKRPCYERKPCLFPEWSKTANSSRGMCGPHEALLSCAGLLSGLLLCGGLCWYLCVHECNRHFTYQRYSFSAIFSDLWLLGFSVPSSSMFPESWWQGGVIQVSC